MGLKTLPQGDGGLHLALSTGVVWAKVAPGGRVLLPETAGVVVDSKYAEYSAVTLLASAPAMADTIPQNTHGTEILSASITPKSATNRVRLRFQGFCVPTTGGGDVVIYAFSSLSSNALNAKAIYQVTATGRTECVLEVAHVPGVTTPVTYSIRIGSTAGTLTMNANAPSSRIFGGAAKATLIVEEIAA